MKILNKILVVIFILLFSFIVVDATENNITVINTTGHGSIRVDKSLANAGDTVTVYYNEDTGYDFTYGVVITKDKENQWVKSDRHGEYTFTMPDKPVYVCGQFTPSGEPYDLFNPSDYISPSHSLYSDVSDDAWYYTAVKYVKDEGLMFGIGNNKFNPGGQVSRAQVAQILYNLGNREPIEYKPIFSDVPNGQWYSKAIIWCYFKGIVSGIGEGRFGTNNSITREQLVTVLWRYKGSPSSSKDLSYYRDYNSISTYAKTAFSWAVESGIVSGKGSNMLAPRGTATRAEMAQIMYNLFK